MKEEDLSRIFQYIGGIARDMTGYVYKVGGMTDHVHILTPLPVTISISDFVRTIKANTSKWIKSLNEDYKDFAWQEGYGVFSVSESSKHDVIQYIENQKLHHKKKNGNRGVFTFPRKKWIRL